MSDDVKSQFMALKILERAAELPCAVFFNVVQMSSLPQSCFFIKSDFMKTVLLGFGLPGTGEHLDEHLRPNLMLQSFSLTIDTPLSSPADFSS